jgi:hypothetical protein
MPSCRSFQAAATSHAAIFSHAAAFLMPRRLFYFIYHVSVYAAG